VAEALGRGDLADGDRAHHAAPLLLYERVCIVFGARGQRALQVEQGTAHCRVHPPRIRCLLILEPFPHCVVAIKPRLIAGLEAAHLVTLIAQSVHFEKGLFPGSLFGAPLLNRLGLALSPEGRLAEFGGPLAAREPPQRVVVEFATLTLLPLAQVSVVLHQIFDEGEGADFG